MKYRSLTEDRVMEGARAHRTTECIAWASFVKRPEGFRTCGTARAVSGPSAVPDGRGEGGAEHGSERTLTCVSSRARRKRPHPRTEGRRSLTSVLEARTPTLRLRLATN